jgi:hypothetical protein
MAQQLIYTSAARLLDAGRSGFGTVARSKTISPLLVSAIERVSQFSNIRGTERSRVIFVHRRMVAGSNRFHILSRIADAGADYTGRTNHIAHHLIVTQEEMARATSVGITPADVLIQFPWLSRWEGNARFLTPEEDVNLATFQPLGRQSGRSGWAGMTGNPSHARLLSWDGAPRNGILLIPVHADPLALLAEGLAEFGSQSWSKAFTTSLETTDELSELDWIIATPATYPEIQRRCGNRATLDLTHPQSLPVPPEPVPEPRKILHPDLTPRTEPNTAANAPQPNIQHVQTGAGRLRVGGSAGEQRRQTPSNPAIRPKQTVQFIAASAVAVMALVILGLVVLKSSDSKAKDGETTAGAPALSAVQQTALRHLEQAGIPQTDAKQFVIAAKDNSPRWVNYIKGVNQAVKSSDPTVNPSWPVLPDEQEPKRSPAWLSSLVEAGIQWHDVLGKTEPPADFAQKLDGIDKISKSLQDYADDAKSATGELQLTKNEIAIFEQTQTIREFNKLLGAEQAAPSQGAKDQLMKAISSGKFDCLKFPKRYEGLVEMIRERFVTIKSPELLAALKGSVANPKAEDLKGLEQALILWDKPKEAAGEEIKNSGFVPDTYEELREAHHESSYPDSLTKAEGGEEPKQKDVTGTHEPMKQPGADLAGLKQKQIIIVTAENLKNGVEVKLIKGLLESGVEAKNLIDEGLTIYIDGKKYEAGLVPAFGQDYVSERFDIKPSNSNLKIYKDGRVSLGSEKGSFIQFSFKSEEKTSHVFVDKKVVDPAIPPTKFSFKKIDENRVEIVGEARELWMAIKEINRHDLICLLYNKNIIHTFDRKNFSITRPLSIPPVIIFSESSINKIQDSLRKLNITNNNKNTKSEKEQNKKDVESVLEEVKKGIQYAIGEALILRQLNKKNKKEITISDDQNLVKIIKDNYDVTLATRKLSENEKDEKVIENSFQEDLNKMIDKVGEAEFDETLQILVGENWDKALPVSAASSKIDKYIKKIIKSAKRPEERPSFDEVLKNVSEITIQTRIGRVLFKATRQP